MFEDVVVVLVFVINFEFKVIGEIVIYVEGEEDLIKIL